MLRSLRILAAGLLIGFLAACATPDGLEVGSLPGNNPQATAFDQALYTAYADMATEQYGINDYVSSDLYARKAKQAAANGLVLPEELSAHNVHPSQVAALTDAHTRLMDYLDRGARDIRPDWAAKAQVDLDCWIEESSERDARGSILEPLEVAACQRDFEASMSKITAFLPAPGPKKTEMFQMMPEETPPPAAAAAGAPNQYLVFFDWNKWNLTPEALSIVRTAASNAKKGKVSHVTVTGHADRSGSAEYNMGLSLRRAEAVKAELVKQGIAASAISTVAKGETDPLVPTPDGVREPQNRRAQIVINMQ